MDLTASRRGRRALFTALYFVEGAPIGFLWWALPALLRARGVEPQRIGALLGWLVLPWAFKWVWSPLIDRFQGPRWTLRAWIAAAQVGMVLSLVPLLMIDPVERFEELVWALLAHAVCASTQDAAIDALMIRVTPEGERGRLTGWMQVGMLAGRSLLGGGALLVHGQVGGRRLTGGLLAALVLGIALAATYRAPVGNRTRASVGASPGFGALLAGTLRGRATWIGLAFAATAGAGFEALGGFAGPLLTDAAGGSTDAAGRFFLVHAVLATALGGLAGGWLADRVGVRRATAACGLALGAAVLACAWRVQGTPAPGELTWLLVAVYLGVGGFTAASYALFMRLTDRRLAATQFSAFMGATNLCESWSVAAAGRLIPVWGYGLSFGALEILALAALCLLPLARRTGPGVLHHTSEEGPRPV